MLFIASAITALLAASTSASPLSARAAKAGKTLRSKGSSVNIPVNATAGTVSYNWAGAVISTKNVTYVQGKFTVPVPVSPSGRDSSTEYCGTAWVGIDGSSCQTGLIQTGVFWCVEEGETSYQAWYEYIPESSIAYPGISVTGGDVISVTVTADGDNGGTTTLENVSSGVSVSHKFSGQTDGTLCGQDAEWIVEDFESDGAFVPFANFSSVTFTDTEAIIGGVDTNPGKASIWNLELQSTGDVVTSTTVSDTEVVVTYTG